MNKALLTAGTIYGILLLAACGQGVDYVIGQQGPAGTPGQNCDVTPVVASAQAPNGGGLLTCPGSQLLILNGSNGSNGQNGSSIIVTPVQFCPGTPSYPSTFIENGFCIGGNLYAVYSNNGGFMALIPPGLYSSDGINASCNFTVGTNCEVSN